MPATPRMSGALPAERGSGNWDAGSSTGRGAWDDQFQITTEPVVGPGFERARAVLRRLSEEEERATNNRRWLSRQDAVVGSSEADASNDLDATWEQCGLAGGKTAGKSAQNAPAHGNYANSVNDTWEGSVNDNWGRRDSPAEQPASRGDWNRPTYYKPEASAHTSRPTAVGGNWRAGNTDGGPRGSAIPNNGNYGPAPQNALPQHRYGARVHDSSPPSASYGPPERKFGSRINPDNYDGNRAGPDGSRVFYSAILPTVPTLRDIANHAEYIAWLDMLRSVLKYHQLAAVIAPDANRPHGYKDGRRWD